MQRRFGAAAARKWQRGRGDRDGTAAGSGEKGSQITVRLSPALPTAATAPPLEHEKSRAAFQPRGRFDTKRNIRLGPDTVPSSLAAVRDGLGEGADGARL